MCSATVTEAAAVSSGREHNNIHYDYPSCCGIGEYIACIIILCLYNTDNDFSTYIPIHIPADITYIRITYVISCTELAKLLQSLSSYA